MIQECLNALEKGEVILFPTDTVYGLLARSDRPQAIEKIYQLKKRPQNKQLIRFVGHLDPQDPDLKDLGPRAHQFLNMAWPGPLTVVGPRGNSLRWAEHDALSELLRQCDGAIVSTSANISGEPPVHSLDQVSEEIRSQVGAFYDGNCPKDGVASTVVRLSNEGYEVLRPGALDAETLDYFWCTRIAFVCTGNTCRSPMAEALARDLFQLRMNSTNLIEKNLSIESAGVYAPTGSLASEEAVQVMEQRGIDLKKHRSQAIIRLIQYPPHFLYGMTSRHVQVLNDLGLNAELLDPSGRDIEDPFGGPIERYLLCQKQILSCLENRLETWMNIISTA